MRQEAAQHDLHLDLAVGEATLDHAVIIERLT